MEREDEKHVDIDEQEHALKEACATYRTSIFSVKNGITRQGGINAGIRRQAGLRTMASLSIPQAPGDVELVVYRES